MQEIIGIDYAGAVWPVTVRHGLIHDVKLNGAWLPAHTLSDATRAELQALLDAMPLNTD